MKVTKEQLKAIMPNAGKNIDTYLAVINKYLDEFKINTPLRLAHYLAQIAHESGELRYCEENLNYSELNLLRVFPRYFTASLAKQYAHKPAQIGARVYANRMGNGNEASKEGYLFRGRGLIQITGKSNYKKYNAYLTQTGVKVDLLKSPDLLALPVGAVKSSMWFFSTHGCNELADLDDVKAITKVINGGYNGLQARERFLRCAKVQLGLKN